jgi:hypothetical protein
MQDYGSWLWLIVDVGFVVLLGAALAYAMMHWRTRTRADKAAGDRATRELYGSSQPERSPPIQPSLSADGEERPTEDAIAQRALGGTRGDASLPPAPMTEQRAKKTPNS